ncbi:hypothetical protein GN958_ATG10902 [Phytophthora infestans]|uniref:Uncharacterized protein n=1 Tax=Phytophthora infestans TaxID=4787 RepID=A0A8S9UH94_PHYIN|nr:hypothetical protein GN958_ATG10902 [Phytophthora infestans]
MSCKSINKARPHEQQTRRPTSAGPESGELRCWHAFASVFFPACPTRTPISAASTYMQAVQRFAQEARAESVDAGMHPPLSSPPRARKDPSDSAPNTDVQIVRLASVGDGNRATGNTGNLVNYDSRRCEGRDGGGSWICQGCFQRNVFFRARVLHKTTIRKFDTGDIGVSVFRNLFLNSIDNEIRAITFGDVIALIEPFRERCRSSAKAATREFS